ncbi:heparinase II/III domain-containing protein [Marinoscillum furvescens]|uniref:Alginate lyase n=1 Tax=Marinoscillum furvescens DSM 4134 TaxID=1122208 RepID=A0A3D9L2I0_MARFU|nr:heparinase II/III family protein [Marinoscillum furvescens]RED96594.1 alginate lyase [Marinoscillum furvescens DSM 4134]
MTLRFIVVFLCGISALLVSGQPSLILTEKGLNEIRNQLGKAPLFDASLEKVRAQIDAEIARPIDVPVPVDLAGGYTHQQHKANFFNLQKAGVLFQITGEEKYAQYVRDVLMAYKELYPQLDRHPAERSYARGKFFWQCLNDANWLVYVSQAYDCIYDWLPAKERKALNKELFRPYADFLSVETPQFFNRIHNHSTWGNAAVGMIGLVMDDEELVQRALYGAREASVTGPAQDNDGGQILDKDQKMGFLAQVDEAFSPDGYYTEGPYYQRYAMYPFLIFAQALANNKPELGILNYRNGLLIKAVYALVNQTNAQGEFFPINDAQKGMSLLSRELVFGVSMAYHYGGNDPELLSIIEKQGRVPLNDAGMAAAKGITEGKTQPYTFKSIELTDGAAGDEGAIGIIRADNLTLLMKYAKHGMGHGHFDRLGFLLYDAHGEVIQDYGAARWVNIEHKDGGGYLKENHSWAKQTLAHNTLVVDKDSHFDGKVKAADQVAGTPYYFLPGDDVQIVSAKETNAYKDVAMHRTMAVVRVPELENPLVIDLFAVQAPEGTRYDLPLYYLGEFMSSNQDFETNDTLTPMGAHDGYQHLWQEAQAIAKGKVFRFTWFNKRNFFTMHSAVREGDELLLTRIGAYDPNFNLRRDPGLIHRRTSGNTLFASLYELHGSYDYTTERPLNLFTAIADFRVLHESADYVAVQFELKNGNRYVFAFSLTDDDESSRHQLQIENKNLEWTGIYNFYKTDNE